MSRNKLYINEVATAYKFLIDNKDDLKLQNFIKDMQNKKMMHSDRWSICYDFLKENYPDIDGSIVTGLAYYLED